MVAIDQRESLRTMIQQTTPDPVPDEEVVAFKIAVAETLARHASAMLFDPEFGYPALRAARAAAPDCGLIVAVDRLVQERGGPVTDTFLDPNLDADALRQMGVVAQKILILWRGEENAAECVQKAVTFMERCRRTGFIGIVEAMVQIPLGTEPDSWDRNTAIVEAAAALAVSRPDLYKADVPFAGRGSENEITAWSQSVTDVIGTPWVVLSAGVHVDDFPRSVAAACRGGASGFLAGRAVWADTIGGEFRRDLEKTSAPRLQRLVEIVDGEARPWAEAASASR
jgi:sulfofructosephosphate aldolase